MRLIIRFVSKYYLPFFAAIAFLMLEVICDLMQPTIMSKIVDIGISNNDIDYVLKMGGLMFLVTAVGAIGAVSRNIISSRVSINLGRDMRSALYTKIQSFSFDSLNKFETASLVTRLTNDIVQVQNFIHGLMRIFVRAPLLCIGGIVMASFLNPRLAWVFILVIPIISLIIIVNLKVGYPFFSRVQKALDRVNGRMREYLSGVRVVKAFNRFSYETQRFDKVNTELSDISTNAMRVMAIFGPGISLTINIGIVIVLWFGGYHVNNGDMQVGQIIAFLNYMTQILFSLNMLSFIFTMFVRAKASAERINEVLDENGCMKAEGINTTGGGNTTGSINTNVSINTTGSINPSISFTNVYFSYRNAASGVNNDHILKDISFQCMGGETLGIIGSTGSGKSTLISLIPRFYDTVSGSVKINGIDVKGVEPEILREKIAIVPQKTTLFSGTIMENLLLGRDNATEADIYEAAKAAQAHCFIEALPEGYQTILGQRGVNLSGGQKQRISIARALVRNPEILILDDCTSAVDVATEALIRKALRLNYHNITMIVIAQRITSVMDTDKILVIDNGCISDMGTHNDLLRTSSVYRDIFRSQIGKGVS